MRASPSTRRVWILSLSAPARSASLTAFSKEETPASRAPAETAAAPASVTAWMEADSPSRTARGPSRIASRIGAPGGAPSSRWATDVQASYCPWAASSSPASR